MSEPDLLEFDCPRCGGRGAERFYGPCRGCRDVLRAEQRGEKGEARSVAFEPRMHVTPNAVATKD